MNPADPDHGLSRDQVIALLSSHLPEWRRRYGIQTLALFASLARLEASPGSDVDLCISLDPANPLSLVHVPESDRWVDGDCSTDSQAVSPHRR